MKKSELRQLIREEIQNISSLPDEIEVRKISGTNRYERIIVSKMGKPIDVFRGRNSLIDFEEKYGKLTDMASKGVDIEEFEVDRD